LTQYAENYLQHDCSIMLVNIIV